MTNRISFLKDVLICSLGAYGGPEAHYGVFMDQMVAKKKYITEEELIELIALCGLLPGPGSTQTIVAIGYKMGGPMLGFLTMLVWGLPAIMIMTALSFLSEIFTSFNLDPGILRFIGPMSAGFIIVAAYRIGKKVIHDPITTALFLMGVLMTYFVRKAWTFPLILIIGGIVAIISSKEKNLWSRPKLKPNWNIMIAFIGFAVFGSILYGITGSKLFYLFDRFYRYGYLVFGGGQVVVPMMYTDLVEVSKYMTGEQFLTGYGLVQGVPGPMFSFSAYASAMAASGNGVLYKIIAGVIGGIGIFLPGILLIYFVYPLWEELKSVKSIKVSLSGINAVAGGMITSAALIILRNAGMSVSNTIVLILTIIILATKKIPAPLVVLGVVIAGIIF